MVHLCTPPSKRLEFAEIATAAKCHIVTEKPMAITLEDAQAMVDMAKKNKAKVTVDYYRRFREGFHQLTGRIRIS